eukprot:11042050-Alexandrium_andersonii.AAC.1
MSAATSDAQQQSLLQDALRIADALKAGKGEKAAAETIQSLMTKYTAWLLTRKEDANSVSKFPR